MKTVMWLFLAIFCMGFSSISAPFTILNLTPIEDYLVSIELENIDSGIAEIDCVYVINLKKKPERWEKTKFRLNAFGINPNRVNAFNGWYLNDFEKKKFFGPYPIRMSGGQIGCIISHVSIMKDALKRGFDCIWICEDDIEIIEDPHQLSYLIKKLTLLNPAWDILYTDMDTKDSYGNRVPSLASDFRPDQINDDLEYYLCKKIIDMDLLEIRQRFGTHSMIISKRGVKKILDYFTNNYLWTSYDIDIHYIPNLYQYSVLRDIVSNDFTAESNTGSPP